MTNQSTDFNLFGADALKAAFRRHASGVAIITASTKAGDPIGFTATSVTSLGSNPPLVSFNIAQGSSSYEHLVEGSHVAIHTLTTENLALSQKLAGPKEDRFKDVEYNLVSGVPVFPHTSAVILASVRTRLEVAANAVIVVDVISGLENSEAEPLLYYRRGYLTTGERLADNF
jgi:flavin reductase (DIM6/NTAB) family NADH-FMN oxidoreductase RutF